MRLSYRSAENTLRLTLDVEFGDVVTQHEIDGFIDIAERGRLVGVELDADGLDLPRVFSTWLQDGVAAGYVNLDDEGAYIRLSAPSEDISSQHVRTANVRVRVELDRNERLVALAIPRRGHGYEISFPSGNR